MSDQIKTNKNEAFTEHGYQSVRHETYTCHNYWCNYKTTELFSKCPKCGFPLLGSQTFRLLGWMIAGLGAILAIAAALLLLLVSTRSIRGMGAKLIIYGVLGLLLVVGLTFIAAGLRQALSGSRSQSLIALILVLLAAIFLIGTIAQIFF